MRLYALHHHHQSLHCQPLQPQFRQFEPYPSGQMPREAYECFGCRLSKDYCGLIWCPLSLFGANVWSCCGGVPPREYLGQTLALGFGDLHCKHLPVEVCPSKMSIETHGSAGTRDYCPPPPDLRCLFDADWPNLLPPVVLVGSVMNDR
jgi:hypothetical protein